MSHPFSKTTLAIVIAVAGVSLAAAAALTIFGDELGDQPTAGVDGYSVSAIGHRGLVQLLEKLDVPVVVSRSNSAVKARRGLLIIAEPAVTDEASRAQLARLIDDAPVVLVVLPKWFGSAERGRVWIDDAHLLPVNEILPVIEALPAGSDAAITRGGAPGAWTIAGALTPPQLREPQLISSATMDPMVARGDQMLVAQAELEDTTLVVLSDPDVLSNFGLRRPENAQFIVQLIDELRDDGPVVFDETLHGYAQPPGLVRTLFRFPLVLATLQLLVCAVLIVWAAMVRFGPRRAAPPPLAPGKDYLIRNTAALLHYGGHHAHALRRYLQLTVGAVRHTLHAPALAPTALTAWLERVRGARGGTISLVELERAVEAATTPAQVIELADQVFRWRMEMTHGSDSRS